MVRPQISFRPYVSSDRETCLTIFDANTPTFFAPEERADYIEWLDSEPDCYEVCVVSECIVGAFGLLDNGDASSTLCWIMLDPGAQRSGVGTAIMERVVSCGKAIQAQTMRIATSQKAEAFFAKFGAKPKKITKNGWGAGLDRIDMELIL